jgi:hypothetical protein
MMEESKECNCWRAIETPHMICDPIKCCGHQGVDLACSGASTSSFCTHCQLLSRWRC